MHDFVALATGIKLHVASAGDPHATPVVLLHGFPDFWFGWREIMPRLVEAGFRVIAPDLRGYNLSDKPTDVKAYAIDRLVEDVVALCDALGIARVNVVGHDWGAGVAWAVAITHPDRVARLAVLNGPHPQRLMSGLKNPVQLAKSWYMFVFQLPGLPEKMLSKKNFDALVGGVAREPVRKLDEEEIARYREAWSQPGALTAMLAYYRAMFRVKPTMKMRPIDTPTLVVWGDRDPHLNAALATPSPKLVANCRVEHVPEGTHWVHRDEPERVAGLLASFLHAA